MTAPRTAGTALSVLLCLTALAGCGSSDGPRVQRVAYCQGTSGEDADGGPVRVEFRQGPTVVASGLVDRGAAFTAEVPVGGVQIYVDDVQRGAANEGVPTDGPYHPPGPDDYVYVATAEGCPVSPPPWPGG
jgi:hypothetical protein